jgi:hypothetical protein
MDRNPAIPIGMGVVLVLLAIVNRMGKRQPKANGLPALPRSAPSHALDRPLFHWTPHDAFTVRDLLNGGLLILGRAGSGKTSSSGRQLMQAIVNSTHPMSGGLILAAKPEDAAEVQAVFGRAKRTKDLIVFDAEGPHRTNFLAAMRSPRDVVQFLMTLSEVMKHTDSRGGGDNSRFYEAQEERMLYNAVTALQAAGEPLTAANLHHFIVTAGRTPEELMMPQWRAQYHSRILDRGWNARKSPIQEHDFELAFDFWTKEWSGLMDEKTRGNILAGVQGTLSVLNTGMVREMVCGATNCSPADVLNGRWILCNFPPSSCGAAGRLISTGWKQLVEQAILAREATDQSAFCVIWSDESHQTVTNFDSSFIAMCRSHKGCLVNLTQSVSSIYAAMKGEAGRHQADALLANFSHVIVHASDPTTAHWASSKLGKRKEILYSGSSSPDRNSSAWDQLYGKHQVSSSFSEHYEQVIQDDAFMVGRTGGPVNEFMCDAVVIRSGEPFSSGRNYLRRAFSQK